VASKTSAESAFPFSEDDRIRVLVDDGDVVDAEAVVENVTYGPISGKPVADIRLAFGHLNSVTVRPDDAEFEVIDDV